MLAAFILICGFVPFFANGRFTYLPEFSSCDYSKGLSKLPFPLFYFLLSHHKHIVDHFLSAANLLITMGVAFLDRPPSSIVLAKDFITVLGTKAVIYNRQWCAFILICEVVGAVTYFGLSEIGRPGWNELPHSTSARASHRQPTTWALLNLWRLWRIQQLSLDWNVICARLFMGVLVLVYGSITWATLSAKDVSNARRSALCWILEVINLFLFSFIPAVLPMALLQKGNC